MVLEIVELTSFAWQADKIAKEAKNYAVTFINIFIIPSLRPSVTDSGHVISFLMQFLQNLC